jgi:glycosyltransferase involved in cell wall biosynthesis
VDILIRAFAELNAQGRATTLTLIGDGPLRLDLERLTQELSLSESVCFAGAVDESRKLQLLRDRADLFVSASVREGISLATLEALSQGLPVVVSSKETGSRNGALEYVTISNGRVADGSAESIAAAVRDVFASQAGYAGLSKGAIETANRYDWHRVAWDLYQHYRKLCETS